jgi:hypothetical protein
MPVDYRVHDLGPEAGWAAKYAHISPEDSVRLVTSNVESILGLDKSKDLTGRLASLRLLLASRGRMSMEADCSKGVVEFLLLDTMYSTV